MTALLEVEGLTVRVPAAERSLPVVHGVGYRVEEGEVFGVAGESGSGKTISALALLGLLPPGASATGQAIFDGVDLLSIGQRRLRRICGREIAMVFQDPLTSFHPMLSIGRQMTEHLRHHLGTSHRDAARRAVDLLDEVRIPDPEAALVAFPHQFSGGMRQRIAIAGALMCEPRLLIADEPTTALDVTVQAGIIRLLDRLRRERSLSVVLITHDLGIMSAVAERLAVFYAGRIVETGPAADVLSAPRHPYTHALLRALPHVDAPEGSALEAIDGAPPRPEEVPEGCAFHPRCAYAVAACRTEVPPLRTVGERSFACPVDPFGDA
jgi:oligopeptide/dipeptide ABC transporter ATP-binding protein